MSKITLLIVEDNLSMANMLYDFFNEDERFELIGTSNSGDDALDKIREFKPNIVLLDLILPVLDGFEVMSRANEYIDNTKFIITSGIKDDVYVKKAIDEGASYYMMKPFSLSNLKKRMLDLCENEKIENNINFDDDYKKEYDFDFEENFLEEKINKEKEVIIDKNEIEINHDERISNLLVKMGVPLNIVGFNYLKEALSITLSDPTKVNQMTKVLYPEVAAKYYTTKGGVERAIRHAIEVLWARGRTDAINEIFGINLYSKNDRPTNSEFIALVTNRLLEQKIKIK